MIHEGEQVAIVGGGLVGCYMSLLLAQQGTRVDIYEQRSELVSKSYGRTINLIINQRGIDSLKQVGVDITKYCVELYGF